MNSNISDKDKKDWENFLSKKENLSDKDARSSRESRNKSSSIDLHGYSLDEANEIIKEFIYNSYDKEISKLIIVTGKGLHSQNEKDPYTSKEFGILKYSVPEFIRNNHELMTMIREIKDANIEDGGSGAFYIFLKKKTIK